MMFWRPDGINVILRVAKRAMTTKTPTTTQDVKSVFVISKKPMVQSGSALISM